MTIVLLKQAISMIILCKFIKSNPFNIIYILLTSIPVFNCFYLFNSTAERSDNWCVDLVKIDVFIH